MGDWGISGSTFILPTLGANVNRREQPSMAGGCVFSWCIAVAQWSRLASNLRVLFPDRERLIGIERSGKKTKNLAGATILLATNGSAPASAMRSNGQRTRVIVYCNSYGRLALHYNWLIELSTTGPLRC